MLIGVPAETTVGETCQSVERKGEEQTAANASNRTDDENVAVPQMGGKEMRSEPQHANACGQSGDGEELVVQSSKAGGKAAAKYADESR